MSQPIDGIERRDVQTRIDKPGRKWPGDIVVTFDEWTPPVRARRRR